MIISFLVCILFFLLSSFSFIWYMGGISSFDYLFCFIGLNCYALSRHRWLCFHRLCFIPFFGLFDTKVCLITKLSITSVTSFMSWVLADDIIADKGMSFLSVKMCLFVPSLLLSTGLLPVKSPPNGDFIDSLSSDCCHINLIPILLSYSFNNLAYIFLKMTVWTHCWNRLWHVEPEPNSFRSIFHWHRVLRTYRIPSSTFVNGMELWDVLQYILVFRMAKGQKYYPIIHLKSWKW